MTIYDYIPEKLRDPHAKTKSALINQVKIKYLKEIMDKHGGRSTLPPIEVGGDDQLHQYANEMSLSDVYYHLSYLLTARKVKSIYCAERMMGLSKVMKEISDYGRPIWKDGLTDTPQLWFIKQEDGGAKHFFLSYAYLGTQDTYFDPILHEFKKYQAISLITCRVHLDHSILIEITQHNADFNKQLLVESDLTRLFGFRHFNSIEITHELIQQFDGAAEAISSERRSGEEAYSSLSRASNEKDTRNDNLRTQLQHREFRLENGQLTIDGIVSIVGVKRGNPGQLSVKTAMPPETQIKFIHRIFNILGW